MSTSKKGFRKIGGSGPINAIPWKYWDEDEMPVAIKGTFIKEGVDKYKKSNYHIKLSEAVTIITNDEVRKKGQNKGKGFDDLELKAGDVLVLNAAGTLDSQMKEVDEGEEIIVEVEGMDEITDESHDYYGDSFYVINVYAKGEDEEEEGEPAPKKRKRL